ncbi:hypothetical protein C922_00118 [Plasmodium inui San Antonio 1]|uniref:AP2/ERF domain-containing protein n=1 Tax=Plasmodium inui San Antonio 1 TaxID=1237626 RepID=W7AC40_9APIC|nr:hypothetical protein C922_00118 [Plasmodium inui San Antonio 1]EUD69255.1 hypothetical protein C922_00118 [Plasmodium inui San Antonio 1]
MDEVTNADQTFKAAVMSMDGKLATNGGSNRVNSSLNAATSPAVVCSMGSTMGSGFTGNMNGAVGSPMSSPVANPMNNSIVNAVGIARTSGINGSNIVRMSNVLGKGNNNKSGSNGCGTNMGLIKSSPNNDPSILANNLVNTVVNTMVSSAMVDTISNGNHGGANNSGGNSSAVNLGNNPVTNGRKPPPAKGPPTQPGTGQVIKKKVGRPKGASSANKVIKKEEKISTSSSGYPGVSWNKRMCAWLAFFYDGASRRSRTFHPKHFNMDKERARLAAVEFMKSLENNGRKKSTKNKTEKNKTKQLNEEMMPGMLNNDMASSLNSRAPNGTPIPMHLMSLNRGFYMPGMNRNFNHAGMSPNDRSSMINTYNPLSNTSNLGGMGQSMQDPGGIYIHNGGAAPPTMFGGNMHMLSGVKGNVNGTSCTSSTNSNGGGSGCGNSGGSCNNMLYLNELMFHSNIMPTGVGGGAGRGNAGNAAGGGNVTFVDRNLSSSHAASELLKLEENLALHNKDMETLMNALFRQNYNMNMGMANMDKHHQYLHSSGKNNGTGQGGMKTSSSSSNGGPHGGSGVLKSVNGVNNSNGVNPIGNSNLPNSTTAANAMNGNASPGPHLYLPNHAAGVNHAAGDVFENGNESSNGVTMPNMTSMANVANMVSLPNMGNLLPNMGNLPNYYDYDFDPYQGNISPHLIDMMHRLNSDMKDGSNKSGGVGGGVGGVSEGRSDDMNELNFCSTDNNAAWINQLKHSHNNLCNNLNGNPCDLCDTSSASPESNMAKKMDMGNREKAANSNATNEGTYNFMAPWNGSNPNSSNNRINDLDSSNDNSVDSSHLAANSASNSNALKLANPNNVLLCMSTNNNQISSVSQNATHLAANIEMNPKESSSHSSSAFSGPTNIQDIQKQLHFQTQSGLGTSSPDLHNALQMAKQTNNFPQRGFTTSNSNGATNNNVSGGSTSGGGSNPISSPTSNGTTAHKKRGPKDNRKALLPPAAGVTAVAPVGATARVAAGVAPAAGSSHAMNTQQAQNGKTNAMNLNFADQNNLCTNLNGIMNFEWLSSDAKTHPNMNNQGAFETGDA